MEMVDNFSLASYNLNQIAEKTSHAVSFLEFVNKHNMELDDEFRNMTERLVRINKLASEGSVAIEEFKIQYSDLLDRTIKAEHEVRKLKGEIEC